MPIPRQGRGAWLGMAEEVTYGTHVAPTNYLRLVSTSVEEDSIEAEESHLIGDGGAGQTARDSFQQRVECGGDYVVQMGYRGVGMLLKHALGSLGTTGGGPYTHTYTLATLPSPGLSTKIGRGTGGEEDVYGNKIARLELSVSAGAEMLATVNVIAKGAQDRDANGTTTPSYGTKENVYHHQGAAAGFSWNGNSYLPTQASLIVENALERDYAVGDVETQEPYQGAGLRRVTLRVTLMERDDTLYNSHRDRDAADLTWVFTGAGNSTMTWTLRNAKIIDYGAPIQGPRGIQRTLTFQGFADASDEALDIVIVNDDSSGIAN